MSMEPGQNETYAERTLTFLVHDPDKVWLVQSGNVDLFLVEAENGQPIGPRHHVLRVRQGSAVFGFEMPSSSAVQLLAAVTPQSQVLEISREGLRQLLLSPAETKNTAQLVEDWITSLSRVSAGYAVPKVFELLEPGKIFVFNEAKAVLSREALVWVHLLEGSAHFLGDRNFPLQTPSPFPVAASAWLDAESGCRLSVTDTIDCLKLDLLWTGLDAFHSAMLGVLIQGRTARVREKL